jgi:hypothetical protein
MVLKENTLHPRKPSEGRPYVKKKKTSKASARTVWRFV